MRGTQQRFLGRLVGSVARVAVAGGTVVQLDVGMNQLGDQGLA